MATKIRLQRRGRKKQPFYHIVVADERAPRDGRFIEKIGTYNPMTKPATIELDRERAFDWLMKGAQPTDTARAILRFKGVMYRKHLERGVKKGALTIEQAEAKWAEWIAAKESKIAKRAAATEQEKADFLSKLSGSAPVIVVPEVEVPAEEEAPAAEEAATEAIAAVEEAAPEAEASEEVVVEEAPEEEATDDKEA